MEIKTCTERITAGVVRVLVSITTRCGNQCCGRVNLMGIRCTCQRLPDILSRRKPAAIFAGGNDNLALLLSGNDPADLVAQILIYMFICSSWKVKWLMLNSSRKHSSRSRSSAHERDQNSKRKMIRYTWLPSVCCSWNITILVSQ